MNVKWATEQKQKRWKQQEIKTGKLRQCAICKRYRSGYGLKTLSDGKEICRKGICRKLFDASRNLDEAISLYKWNPQGRLDKEKKQHKKEIKEFSKYLN